MVFYAYKLPEFVFFSLGPLSCIVQVFLSFKITMTNEQSIEDLVDSLELVSIENDKDSSLLRVETITTDYEADNYCWNCKYYLHKGTHRIDDEELNCARVNCRHCNSSFNLCSFCDGLLLRTNTSSYPEAANMCVMCKRIACNFGCKEKNMIYKHTDCLEELYCKECLFTEMLFQNIQVNEEQLFEMED